MASAHDAPTARLSSAALLRAEGGPLTPGSARSLLITILGELVWPADGPVWTSTLLKILTGLGVEEQTARQAIARAAASDWLVPERRGREVAWSLSPKLAHIFDAGSSRVYSLSDPFSSWDGRWLALWTTVPATHRSTRRPLYAGLTWAGFGNPAPSLWMSPHIERAEEVRALIQQLDLAPSTVSLVGTSGDIGMTDRELVERGWDLGQLQDHYRDLERAVLRLDPKGGEAVLRAHVRMLSDYRELPRADPQLPEALLPDWIGRRVARRIEQLRATWAPTTHATFAELNAGG